MGRGAFEPIEFLSLNTCWDSAVLEWLIGTQRVRVHPVGQVLRLRVSDPLSQKSSFTLAGGFKTLINQLISGNGLVLIRLTHQAGYTIGLYNPLVSVVLANCVKQRLRTFKYRLDLLRRYCFGEKHITVSWSWVQANGPASRGWDIRWTVCFIR